MSVVEEVPYSPPMEHPLKDVSPEVEEQDSNQPVVHTVTKQESEEMSKPIENEYGGEPFVRL